MSKLTNQSLRDLLVKLGFEPGALAERNHRVFRHPASGCALLLPDNKSSEPPRPADLMAVQVQLAHQGHLDKGAFDYFVEHATLPA
nr:hypothetical protein [uncultured bacterium]